MLRSGYSAAGWIPDVVIPPLANQTFSAATADEEWMHLALREAMHACAPARPNPAVGCLIIDHTQKVLSKGHTSPYGGPHAEANALVAAAPNRLAGATLYVTLEPCCHQGKQGPCTDLIIKSGVKRVVFGAKDPNPLVSGKGAEALRRANIEVIQGTLAVECEAWHRVFAHQMSPHRSNPYIALKWAQTSNGLLADDTGHSKWISNKASRSYTHWLRNYYDGILVGSGTILKDHPALTVRNIPTAYPKKNPYKIVFDPEGHLAKTPSEHTDAVLQSLTDAHLLTASTTPYTWCQSSLKNLTRLETPNFSALQQALASLPKDVASIMVEGGPTLLNLFLRNGTYQAIHSFRSTKTWEGSKHRIEFEENSHFPAVDTDINGDQLREYFTPQSQLSK